MRERLPADVGEALWLAVRGNLTTLADAATWADIVAARSRRVLEDPAFLEEAAARCRPSRGARPTWKEWTGAVSAATRPQGPGAVPSAAARAHGAETGPEMARLLPLIGRAKARARLEGEAA